MGNYENGIETQERIVKACRKLFYEKGYNETTFKDICKEANVNQSSIHYHFKSKINIYILISDIITKKLDTECNKYISDVNDNNYLFLMLRHYLYYYKYFKDKLYRKFNNAVNLYSTTYIKRYIKIVFLDTHVLLDQYKNLHEQNLLDLTVCYYADMGISNELQNRFEEFSKKYDFKYFAEYNIRLYTRMSIIDSQKVDETFREIEDILPIVDWDALDTTL